MYDPNAYPYLTPDEYLGVPFYADEENPEDE
jgi:hypothetical protein